MKKAVLIGTGWVSLAFGIAGIFLPLLPTTPFLLLAAFCFSRTSPRFHSWLMNHPKLGPPVNEWRQRGVIRLGNKQLATLLILVTVILSTWKLQDQKILVGTMFVTISAVLVFIWSRPSR